MERRIIGIAADCMSPKDSAFGAERQYTNSFYTDAIAVTGGIPILLLPSIISPEEVIDTIDGLLLQGGGDVDPALYGQERSPLCGESNSELDQFQIGLVKAAIKKHKPILGVCRGCQLINVVYGGTLYQDESACTKTNHARYLSPEEGVHQAFIERNTLLSSLFPGPHLLVNSLHHQIIDKVGEGLCVSARGEDGCIEAVEDKEKDILAVQWHPEALLQRSDMMMPLFWHLTHTTIKS